jgi:hypothetical protein
MLVRILFAPLLLTLIGCVTAPMSRGECGASGECKLSGMLTPATVGDIDMARMELPDGQCVAVSLPDHMLRNLFESGAYQTILSGRVFDDPGPEANVAQIIVNGRDVGSGLCGGDFFVFVY